jgi:hypothetical protein
MIPHRNRLNRLSESESIPRALEVEVVIPIRKPSDGRRKTNKAKTCVDQPMRPTGCAPRGKIIGHSARPNNTAAIGATTTARSLDSYLDLAPSQSDSLEVHCGGYRPPERKSQKRVQATKNPIIPAVANSNKTTKTSDSPTTAEDELDLANARVAMKRAEYGMKLAELGLVRARIKARAASKTSGRRDASRG